MDNKLNLFTITNIQNIQQQQQKHPIKTIMKQTYLQQHIKNNPKLLPLIKKKKIKTSDSTFNHLKQPTQQSILLELQDIDQSLNNKNYRYRNGNLFSDQVNDKVVQELHALVKKNLAAIVQDGFSLWSAGQDSRPADSSQKRLSTKLETLNEKLVKLSLQNVYEYDLRKYMQIMKHNRNRWSLYKRDNLHNSSNLKQQPNQTITSKKLQQKMKKQLDQIRQHSYNSPTASTVININSPSKQSNSQQTTLSPATKLSKLLQTKNISHISRNNGKTKFNRKVLTQISQITNPQDQQPQISKYNIKNMLKKQTNPLIFLWLPPATYPQFHGMFTYIVTRKITICRLKKYFFFRRSLNQRFFNSIIQQISVRENKYIEGIEIVTNKTQYTKIFQPIGWKMKSIQSTDKIRIRYTRLDI